MAAQAKPARGWRKAMRWLGRGAAALLALVVVLVAVVLVVIHTAWGREKLRAQVERSAQEFLIGKISIGKLEGSVFTRMVVRDLVIYDAQGVRAVAVGEASFDISVASVASGLIHIGELVVRKAEVQAIQHADGLNLITLIKPNDEPSAWDVRLDQIRLEASALSYQDAGDVIHVDELAGTASASVVANGPIEARYRLAAKWRERAVPMQVAGDVRLAANVITINDFSASIDEVVVTAKQLHGHAPRISGQLSLSAPAASVQRLMPAVMLPGDVRLETHLTADKDIVAAIKASLGSESMSGEAIFDPAAMRVRAKLVTKDLNAQALAAAAPPSAMSATLTVDLAMDAKRSGVQALNGTVKLDGSARYGAKLVNEAAVTLDVAVAQGRAELAIVAKAPGATEARFDGVIEVDEANAVRLTKGHLVAASSQMSRAYVGLPPVGGTLRADINITGTLSPTMPVLQVAGYVRGTNLRYGDITVANAKFDIEATGLPGKPKGKAYAVVDGVSLESDPIGTFSLTANANTEGQIAVKARSSASERWKFDVDATVAVSSSQVDVRVGAHDLRLRGIAWQGQGGLVTLMPDAQLVRVTDFRTSIAGGGLHAHASYYYAGRREGDVTGQVALDGVELAQIDKMLDLGGGLTGRADLKAGLRQGPGGTYGTVAGTVKGLRIHADAPAVDVGLDAVVAPRQVKMEGSIQGDTLGRVAMSLDVKAPARVTSGEAWQRLDRRDLTRGTFAIEALDLAVLATIGGLKVDPALGPSAQPGGRVDGTLTLLPEGGTGTLHAQNVTGLAMLPGPLHLDATLASSIGADARAELSIDATARVENLGTGRLAATVELPARPFAMDGWMALNARAFKGASFSATGLELDTALARRAGLATTWTGKLNVAVDIAPALAGATAKLAFVDVQGGPLQTPISATLDANVDITTGITALLTSALATGEPLLKANFEMKLPAHLATTPRANQAAALMELPLTGTMEMNAVPAQAIATALGRKGRMGGTVSLVASVKGSAKSPIAEATLTLNDVGTRRAAIRELTAKMTYGEGNVTLDIASKQEKGGNLGLTARAQLAKLEAAMIKFTAKDFDLEPLTRLGPPSTVGVAGLLDADVMVAGINPDTTSFVGMLRLREAELPIHPLVGTLRNANISISAMDAHVVVNAEGTIGRGRVTLQGKGAFAGLVPTSAEADLKVVDVQIINEQQPVVSGNAKLALTRAGAIWQATTTVSDGNVVLPEKAGQELHPVGVPGDVVFTENGRPPPAATAPPPGFAAIIGQRPLAPYLIFKIVLNSARVQTAEFRGAVGGTLTTQVGDDAISIEGAIETQRSDISLFDRRYRIERAAVRFDGSLDPLLDIELVHEFPELVLYLMVGGRFSKPKLTLRSDPASYSEGQLFSILLGGQPGKDPGRGMRDAATALTSSFLSQKVTGYLDPYLPIDVDVLTYEAATGDSAGAVTIGKWLTARLYVAYRRHVESRVNENSGEAQLEYWIGRRVMVDGVVGDRGVHGVDLLWTKRW